MTSTTPAVPEKAGGVAELAATSSSSLRHTAPQEPARDIYDLSGPCVKVVVGEGNESRTYHLPAHLLKRQSVFFHKALSRNWKEGITMEVNLPKDSAVHFNIFVRYLFNGQVDHMEIGGAGGLDNPSNAILLATSCWALGDKLACMRFCKACLEFILDRVNKSDFDHHEHIQPFVLHAYKVAPQGSNIRKLAAWMAARSFADNDFDEISAANSDVFADLAMDTIAEIACRRRPARTNDKERRRSCNMTQGS